jgi:hypothetical protein
MGREEPANKRMIVQTRKQKITSVRQAGQKRTVAHLTKPAAQPSAQPTRLRRRVCVRSEPAQALVFERGLARVGLWLTQTNRRDASRPS